MKTLMTTTAFAALLAVMPALSEEAPAPAPAEPPAATAPAPDATTPADPNAPMESEAPPATPAPGTAETPPEEDATKPPSDTAAAPAGEGQKFVNEQASDDLLASSLIGSTVFNTADENLGDINDVVFSKDGKIDAVVIGVGGFLGIGEKSVAVSFDQIESSQDDSGSMIYRVNASAEELTSAPEFMTLADKAAAQAPAPDMAPTAPSPAPAQ